MEALTLLDNWAFFVERAVDSTWRIASIRITEGTPTFTAPKTGRTPAMLQAAGDVFYYDGNSRNVYSLSADLKQEEVIAKDFICSPIAAADRIYCAQFNGLFELPKVPAEPRKLAEFHRAPIAQIIASPTRVAWISDVGNNKLAVMALPIAGPAQKRK